MRRVPDLAQYYNHESVQAGGDWGGVSETAKGIRGKLAIQNMSRGFEHVRGLRERSFRSATAAGLGGNIKAGANSRSEVFPFELNFG